MSYLRALLLIGLLQAPFSAISQFLYLGVNGSSYLMKWNDMNRPGFTGQMNLIHRPSRFWGYGVEISLVRDLGKEAIEYPWNPTSTGRFNLYKPTVYEYSAKPVSYTHLTLPTIYSV